MFNFPFSLHNMTRHLECMLVLPEFLKLTLIQVRISFSASYNHINLCLDYLQHDHDLGPLSTSAPPKCSPLHVDPVSGVYIGMDEEELQLYTSHHDLQFSLKSLHISSDESLSRICEDRKLSSTAVKNIKKKLLTIKSWPNLIRKPAKQIQ